MENKIKPRRCKTCQIVFTPLRQLQGVCGYECAKVHADKLKANKAKQERKILKEKVLTEQNKIHPTQKPVKLYKWILDKYATQGDKILDTHLGSGSIAIACHDYGFNLTACELDKEYFDKAMERIKNHTNQTKLF